VKEGRGNMEITKENMKLIEERDIPKTIREEKWNRILSSIPVGKAWAIEDEKIGYSVQGVLRRRRKKGQYLNLILKIRNKKYFVINPKKEDLE